MPKVLQINECLNGSTGLIARQIGDLAVDQGWSSWICYSAYESEYPCKSNLVKIGSKADYYMHALQTRLFDNHGLASVCATKKLLREIEAISPDIVHIHLLHGYYLNYKILFDYLAKRPSIKIVWTLHDCWSITGHCAFFEISGCDKWKSGCRGNCPEIREYPKSYSNRTDKNWIQKKEAFLSVADNVTLVPVSKWLNNVIQDSFLSSVVRYPIYNGVDIEMFRPLPEREHIKDRFGINTEKVVLGVASFWDERKGLKYFVELSKRIPNATVVLVGLNEEQIKTLPDGVVGLGKTKGQEELSEIYNMADVLCSFSLGETFGMTLAESMACGTPVVVFDNTAQPELVAEGTGYVTKNKDIEAAVLAVNTLLAEKSNESRMACREHAVKMFDKNDRYKEYINLYNDILSQK